MAGSTDGRQDSSVGTATRYKLYGSLFENRRERDFLLPSRPALGPTQPPVQFVSGLWGPPSLLYNLYRVFPPGLKPPGRGVDHPLICSAEVKERV